MKHVFIINPAAGHGGAESVYLSKLIAYLKDKDLDYELHRTLNKQEIGTYTKQRASLGDPVRFYACGGDGTICDVLNGIIGFDNAELAVIPCGTGNDFVKNFTNVKNFHDFDKLINGHVEKIDVIKYNDDYSINMLNIGADCQVVVRADELKSRFKGPLAYAVGALEIIPKGPSYKMSLTYEDGSTEEKGLLLLGIANGKYCGGGFKSCPKASIRDGLIDVSVVTPPKGVKIYPMILKYRQGTHISDPSTMPYLKYVQCKSFDVSPVDEGIIVSVDGEVFPLVHMHVEVVPKAVNFVVPDGSEIID